MNREYRRITISFDDVMKEVYKIQRPGFRELNECLENFINVQRIGLREGKDGEAVPMVILRDKSEDNLGRITFDIDILAEKPADLGTSISFKHTDLLNYLYSKI